MAKCLFAVRSRGQRSDRPGAAKPVDSWYFIDGRDQTHGPLPAREILSFMSGVACWIWREGLPDWVSSDTNPEFLQALRSPPPLPAKIPRAKRKKHRTMVDLIDICNAILADGIVTAEEVEFLSHWLQEAGVIKNWPWTEIAETVERIMADGW